ncbi:MAG: OmpA family protein [Myxococcales bacterium]|nr:OmpA family protein [Myxococcales bacterium]
MKKLICRTATIAAVITAMGAAGTTSTASANVEVGITAGPHFFSVNNELGVADDEDATSVSNSAFFGLRIGYYFSDMLGVEVEGGVIPTESLEQVFDVWVASYRLNVVAQFGAEDPNKRFIPFVLLGGGLNHIVKSDNTTIIQDMEGDSAEIDSTVYAGAGFKVRLDRGWGLRLDARAMVVPSSRPASDPDKDKWGMDYEGLVSIYKEFGRKEGKFAPEKKVLDTDGDGIADGDDKCVDEAEDMNGFEDEDGCPDGAKDTDSDGIADATDKCVTDAEDVDGFEDTDGCPDPDNDGDGILDGADKCATDAEDKNGFEDEDGCPDATRDTDGDGVYDLSDKCPAESETANGYQDADGCPDQIPAAVRRFTGVIKGINFKTGEAVILKSSNKTLDAAAKLLIANPELKLEVQGHTDNVGDAAANLTLSQARADAVRTYLISKGVAETALVARGYGQDKPIADNAKKAGKAQNRRVEFKLLSDLIKVEAAPEPAPAPAPAPTPAP